MMAGMLGVGATHSRLRLRPFPPPPLSTIRLLPLHLSPAPHPCRLPPRTLVTAAAMAPASNAAADTVQEEHHKVAPAPLMLKVKRLSPNAVLPSRASAHAAGYDLSSAQMVVERVAAPEVVQVDDLEGTARGQGGFGSTGV